MPTPWEDVIDLRLANRNCESDIYGDWYRDPWQWSEMRWVVASRPEFVFQRLNASGVLPAVKTDVAKENFATRPAVIMDPVDRLAYQALVDSLSLDLIGSLRDWVFGWRLPQVPPTVKGKYSKSSKQWDGFRARLADLAETYEACLTTDIVSYFASIDLPTLDQRIRARRSNAVTDRLIGMLDGWDRTVGRSGLVQRSAGSAVLANFFLGPLDDVLDRHGSANAVPLGPATSVTRWMDDIWLAGNDVAGLRSAQRDLEQALRGLGLQMNMGKTKILEGDDFASAVEQREHSAVDKGLTSFPVDETPLNERIDRILGDPEGVSRTLVRFVTVRMRGAGAYERVADLAAVAHRIPHGADHLARLFRDSGHWRELQEWYVEYQQSDWACIEWSVAQFGTMFPSDQSVIDALKESLVGSLIPGGSLNQMALASQRIAAWDPATARVVIADAAARSSHHLERRVLGFAALAAGEETDRVRAMLDQLEENNYTLQFLEDRAFRAVRADEDFAGVANGA